MSLTVGSQAAVHSYKLAVTDASPTISTTPQAPQHDTVSLKSLPVSGHIGETCSRPHSPDMDGASETEGIDADEAEGNNFDEEEEGKDSVSGIGLEGGEDLDSVVSAEREEVGVDIPIM